MIKNQLAIFENFKIRRHFDENGVLMRKRYIYIKSLTYTPDFYNI